MCDGVWCAKRTGKYAGGIIAVCDNSDRSLSLSRRYRQSSPNENNNQTHAQNYQDRNENVQLRDKSQQSPSNRDSATATSSSRSSELFSKWSAAMKSKSAEVKGKLLDYIVNPTATSPNATGAASTSSHFARQPSSSPYRQMASVFSIDEDQEDSVVSDLPPSRLSSAGGALDAATSTPDFRRDQSTSAVAAEVVQLSAFVRAPDVIKAYKCHEVHMNGYMYDSHLIVTGTHLVVVREVGRRDEAQIIGRRPLSSIVKITAKKRQRDLITFKYGMTHGDTLVVTDMDRFLIPNASAATALVSQQILRQLESPSGAQTDDAEGNDDDEEFGGATAPNGADADDADAARNEHTSSKDA